MSPPPFLAILNALLNFTSAVLLVCAYAAIRRRRIRAHATLMIAAFCVSTLFLISYVTYHIGHGSTRYPGEGGWRLLYYAVLVPHVLLAVALLPLALRTLYLAARQRWALHKRLARWTFPIWLYVSVTGVVVYLMLYHF